MILCCGEALIDMLPRETTQGEQAFAPYAGGAVFNTAIALGRLEAEPGFFCPLSSDLFGELLVDTLHGSDVDTSLSPRPDAPTTLAFVRLQDGHATYTFYDENSALTSLRAPDLPACGENVKALFFGGISLAAGPSAEAFQALMEREAPGRVTMIDPNIRPSFIRDRDAYVARIRAMMSVADIVKLSDEDLEWLEGAGDNAALANRLIERGTKLVLITLGAEGAVAYTADKRVFVPSQKVEVVDTVGAGDTFNAGVLYGLQTRGQLTKAAIAQISEADIKAALEMGAKCAAITVSRAGANPPTLSEL
ncbi:carbohydrate kinase [uncultured Litoreibacter sp.]|uniref:carbohydrate kinase family protein n=1 Tax=uncultured Litoreibacter sp. TaxID=1392394 RepID=UPI0026302A80|nr:carbohydrate kinase [uncultured Litoreibacter sp.]